MTLARSPRLPIVAWMLFSDGHLDAVHLDGVGARLRQWHSGDLAACLALPATARQWQREQRDLLLVVLAVLIAPIGRGPATAAERVVARLARFGDGGGATLGDADRVCVRIRALGLPIPKPRQVYNLLCRKSAIDAAVRYIEARGFRLRPGHLGASQVKGTDDETR